MVSMDKLESLTDPSSQATVTRVFHAEGQALGQSGHQIRLDYKPENKPPARRAWSSAHWWVSGLAVPLVGGVLMLMGSAGGEAPAPATAIVTASMFETRPLPLPPLTAKDAAPTVVASQPVEPGPVDLADLKELDLEIRRGDTLDQLFRKHGLDVAELQEMLALPEVRPGLRIVKPGDVLHVRSDASGIVDLTRRLDESHTLVVERGDEGFRVRTIEDVLDRRMTQAHGLIESSLFNAGKSAGVSDKVILELAGIFAWDIDFVLDLREGDDFSVLYEQIFRDGEYLRDGEIVGAEFTNDGDTFRAIRYVTADGRVGYYTPDGLSMRKAFLRAPLEFTRVSSEFNPRRRHPILNTIRAHQGVDYAAPAGTPVKAAGDGKVLFAGRKGGYGNCIVLQHGGNVTTLYGHLSRFAPKLRGGMRVQQGQTIGFVGMTGLATAPHLHYEYRIADVHQNPRTVKLPQADPIAPGELAAFRAQSAPLLQRLALVKATKVAQVDP
jgi:murein DD-endopeptidase MepM/ murein hydrolase activator NlpD